MLTQRDAFFDRIYERAKTDRDVVVVSADMSAPSLDKFRRDLPDQFVNVGIAEQNAILIGSGLALTGKKVIAYAIAPFITLRALEQIRVNQAIMGIPLTIAGMGTGLSYEHDGPTHHLIEDISILRVFPHINIWNVSDNVMAAWCADFAQGSNYVRLDKDAYPDIYHAGNDFSRGLSVLKKGIGYILSTGPMTHVAMEIADEFGLGVIDIFKLPINPIYLVRELRSSDVLFTLEEHFLPGGLGSAVAEILCDRGMGLRLKRLGLVGNYSYTYGGRENVRRSYGLDRDSIKRAINETLRRIC